ncbi:hypothetical protein ACSSS7_003080 [Eimeria intestinalis]
MGRQAFKGAPGRRVSKTQRKKETGTKLSSKPSGAAGSLTLLELQLQALVSNSTCAPPASGHGGAQGVIADLLSYLKEFFNESFRPVRISLDKDQSDDAASPNLSERAASLFSRIPGNANAREKDWLAPQPARVEVVGSCGAGLGPPSFARNVDLVFQIPEASLDTRDYLNYRYLAKRAAYVDAVHAQLKNALASALKAGCSQWAKVCKEGSLQVEVAVLPWRCDAAKPYLSLRFREAREVNSATAHAEDNSARPSERMLRQLQIWEVRMFPSCPVGFFKEKLLRADANAVRRRTTATRGVTRPSHQADAPLSEAEVKMLPPTPYYNALILEDTKQGFSPTTKPSWSFWQIRGNLHAEISVAADEGLCGFTLSFVLAHVCNANAEVARVATPAQLFRLALTFLAASDFKKHFFCFGQSEGLPKRALEEATIALLDAAVGSRNDAADAVSAAPSAIAVATELHQQETHSQAQQQWGRRELCVGLVEEACLFDSDEKTFNILWRAQLHIQASRTLLGLMLVIYQELQHEARSSLKALQSLEDPFLCLFGEHQEELFLKSDLWVQVPCLPPRGDAYDLEASVPAANYKAPALNQRHAGQDVFDGMSDAPKHVDPPKWEASPAFLGAATLGRLLVRGLSDRLQILRFRFTQAELVGLSEADGGAADRCPVGVLLCASLNGKASSRLLDRGPPVVDASEAASQSPKAIAADSFRQVVGLPCKRLSSSYETHEAAFGCFCAFAALKNLLCSLSSVPLAIKQIWHSDAALRHTEVVSTNTWEPEAAEDFSLKPITSRLGKALHANKFNSGEATSAGSCSMSHEKAALQTCDMLLQEDVAFLASTSPFKGDTVAQLRSLWWGPQVSAMLHSLALRHTAFAGAVRLATLWLSKQLVVGAVHFAEHVMAFLFVDHLRAGYGEEPQSPHVALLRYGSLSSSIISIAEDEGHRGGDEKIRSAGATLRSSPNIWKGLFCTDWRQFDIVIRLKDPLADPAMRPAEPAPKKKRRFANLAFNPQTERKSASLLNGLLQQEGATDITLQLAAKGIHLSTTAPEAAAVLDDLLLRALGSRACVRKYLFLRFLQRLCRVFPDALVVGFDFVQAQQLAGGLPDSVALKIPPGLLLCKPLQPSSASPRLLFCPSWGTRREASEGGNGESIEEGILATEQGAPMAVLSPPMLLGGIMSSGAGLLQEVLLT